MWTEYVKIGASILASIGSAGAIILALSSWLAKIWANRILEADRAKYARELQAMNAQYQLVVKSFEIRATAIQPQLNDLVPTLHNALRCVFNGMAVLLYEANREKEDAFFERMYPSWDKDLSELSLYTYRGTLLLPKHLHDRLERTHTALSKIGMSLRNWRRSFLAGENPSSDMLESLKDEFRETEKEHRDTTEDFRRLLGTALGAG